MEKKIIISNVKNEFIFWKKIIIICFVNVETDPRLGYIKIINLAKPSTYTLCCFGEGGMPFVVRYIEQHQSWAVIWHFKTNSLVSVILKPLFKKEKEKVSILRKRNAHHMLFKIPAFLYMKDSTL
jgi:hypothetical protein